MSKFEIKHRLTGEVLYTCELNAEIAGKSYGLQLGFAVKSAVDANAYLGGAYLRGADLRGAYLGGANLGGANLGDAYLGGAYLRGADLGDAYLGDAYLGGANLGGAYLRGAYLGGANLGDAYLGGAYLRGADLRGAYLRGADLGGCPARIPNIHQTIYAAASQPDALDMSSWHNVCGTTHCRAGWAVHLAGDAGKALEWMMGTPAAAAVIYMASDPKLERVPDFYCGNEEALADMRRLAEAEATA